MNSIPTTSTSPIPSTPTLTQRIASVFTRLAQLVGDRLVRDRSEANLARVLMAQACLLNFSRRLRNLIKRVDAGKVSKPRAGKVLEGSMPRVVVRVRKPGPPRKFGWLRDHAGPDYHHVNWGIDQVERLLLEPATLEKLTQAPVAAGRIMRSLCHMLGVATPEAFRRPPAPRRARPRKVKEVRVLPFGRPRVASANWPKGCVLPGETVPLRKRNRARQRRNE